MGYVIWNMKYGFGSKPLGRRLRNRSAPISLQREPAPIIRRSPTTLPPHLFLSGAERGGGRHLLRSQHTAIEAAHHLGRGLIFDRPECNHHSRGAGRQKSTRQTQQSFSWGVLTQSAAAGAEDNQFSRQPETMDVLSR